MRPVRWRGWGGEDVGKLDKVLTEDRDLDVGSEEQTLRSGKHDKVAECGTEPTCDSALDPEQVKQGYPDSRHGNQDGDDNGDDDEAVAESISAIRKERLDNRRID